MNIPSFFVAALIPMVVGFIYYHKSIMGSAWMSASGLTEEKLKKGNMPVILLISYLFSVLLAFMVSGMVNHQTGLFSLFEGDTTDKLFQQVMEAKGTAFRTFKHGVFHGFLAAVGVALPIFGTNALFEQKGWRYIWINFGYWAITLMLMGGLLCAWI